MVRREIGHGEDRSERGKCRSGRRQREWWSGWFGSGFGNVELPLDRETTGFMGGSGGCF